ncbi:MAG: hypothetical protein VXX88_02660 [Pseudomonadota bacterium]|nr:hypothetical protein [Pseudomonadota bacterium]
MSRQIVGNVVFSRSVGIPNFHTNAKPWILKVRDCHVHRSSGLMDANVSRFPVKQTKSLASAPQALIDPLIAWCD